MAPQSATAFSPSSPTLKRQRAQSFPPQTTSLRCPLVATLSSSSERVPPASHLQTRRAFISTLGAFLGLSFSAHLERALAAPLQTLRQIRATVDDIDPLIAAAKWDSVRTLLAREPVVGAREACNALLDVKGEELRGPVVGLREDLVSAIRLLDTSVYSNVFVGEDREILGTKVDFDVPRIYLADVKEALDALIEIASA